MARDPREEYRHMSDKLQTFEDIIAKSDPGGLFTDLDLAIYKYFWDSRGEQDALIADERAKIFPDSNKFYNCNDELREVCESIAEDIGKL